MALAQYRTSRSRRLSTATASISSASARRASNSSRRGSNDRRGSVALLRFSTQGRIFPQHAINMQRRPSLDGNNQPPREVSPAPSSDERGSSHSTSRSTSAPPVRPPSGLALVAGIERAATPPSLPAGTGAGPMQATRARTPSPPRSAITSAKKERLAKSLLYASPPEIFAAVQTSPAALSGQPSLSASLRRAAIRRCGESRQDEPQCITKPVDKDSGQVCSVSRLSSSRVGLQCTPTRGSKHMWQFAMQGPAKRRTSAPARMLSFHFQELGTVNESSIERLQQ